MVTRSRPPTVHGVGERIRALRMARDMTQTQLADAVGVISRASLAQIESGRHGPTLGALVALADVLETTTDALLGRTTR